MLSADAQGNTNAVEIGGAGEGSVNEHESVPNEAQASQDTSISAETVNPDATGAPTVQDNFIADQFALKFRGKTIIPKSREELINLAQQGHSYQRQKEEFQRREAQIKELEAKYGQQSQLAELFEQNPEFKKAVYDVYHRFSSGQQQAPQATEAGQIDIEGHPLVQQLRDKIDKIESGYKTWEDRQATETVEKEISSLKGAHADEDWTSPDADTGKTLEIEVLEHADKNGFKTLESAYRDLRWENMQTQIKAQALKEAEKNKLDATRAGAISKGGSAIGSPQPKMIPRSATYDQIAQQAISAMK